MESPCCQLERYRRYGRHTKYALFSLALPAETDTDDVVELYTGILELANKYDVKVIGGNISKAPVVFIDSIVYGVAENPDIMLTRSAALPETK